MAFVNLVRRRGGWGSVDAVWERPPVSTEQLLHPEKYLSFEAPQTVPVPAGPQSPGWIWVRSDVYGEAMLRTMLRYRLADPQADEAAEGWGGDRIALYERPSSHEFAVVLRVRFDVAPGSTPALHVRQARSALDAVMTRFDERDGKKPDRGPTGPIRCVERYRTGPMAITHQRQDVIVVAGPYRNDGSSVASTSVCKAATHGSRELRLNTNSHDLFPSGERIALMASAW